MVVKTGIMGTGKMGEMLTRGLLFDCIKNTEDECFNRMSFATEKAYGSIGRKYRFNEGR